MSDTKDKILDTAERLFGAQGYAATSLRHVIAEAGVNLAAVHYHFGTKEDLLDAVVSRKVAPVNEARMTCLRLAETDAGERPPEVAKVLAAFLIPTAEVALRSPNFVRLMGQMLAEGMMPRIVEKHFESTGRHFVNALRRAVPDLPEQELLWRVHFMIGAMSHTMCRRPVFAQTEDGVPDIELRLERLVTFLAAGFRAPATAEKEK